MITSPFYIFIFSYLSLKQDLTKYPTTSNSVILLSYWDTDTLKDFQNPTVKAILSDPIIHLLKIIRGPKAVQQHIITYKICSFP